MLYKKIASIALSIVAVSAVGKGASSSNNRFGINLYHQVRQSESDKHKNTFISPVSAYLALSMVANGAAGDTERAILSTISAANLTREELNRLNRELMTTLNEKKDFTLEVANSLWTREEFRFRPEFTGRVEANYDARARSLDFTSPAAAAEMNAWVKEKTHDKIKNIVEEGKPLDGDFYLMNATYFKGDWMVPFDEHATRREDFRVGDRTIQVDMMHNDLHARYLKGDGYQAIELMYGEQGSASAILVLPTGSLEELEQRLSYEEWDKLTQELSISKSEYLTLALPKFKFEYESNLIPILSKMGMEVAFSPLANFFDLSPARIVLHKALQKTYVALDEKGTEAAAVTIIGGTTSVPPKPKIKLEFDRPFLFGIRETKSNALLFLGSISNPEFKE